MYTVYNFQIILRQGAFTHQNYFVFTKTLVVPK